MHTAAANGHEKVMKCLIDRGASVNSRSFYLWTPLMQASAYGQISCSSMLVEQGMCEGWQRKKKDKIKSNQIKSNRSTVPLP